MLDSTGIPTLAELRALALSTVFLEYLPAVPAAPYSTPDRVVASGRFVPGEEFPFDPRRYHLTH